MTQVRPNIPAIKAKELGSGTTLNCTLSTPMKASLVESSGSCVVIKKNKVFPAPGSVSKVTTDDCRVKSVLPKSGKNWRIA